MLSKWRLRITFQYLYKDMYICTFATAGQRAVKPTLQWLHLCSHLPVGVVCAGDDAR